MRYSVDFTDLKVERMKMKQIVMVLGLGGSALALFGTPLAQAHDNKAHVHGSAVLQVVMDGETVELALQSPLNNLLGFEHAPRTESQKKALKAMQDKFHKPLSLFALNAEARCTIQAVELDLPFTQDSPPGAPAASHDGHADMEAVIRYQCDRPALLKNIEVPLFESFPGVHRIDAQVVSVRGQSAARLTPAQRQLQW